MSVNSLTKITNVEFGKMINAQGLYQEVIKDESGDYSALLSRHRLYWVVLCINLTQARVITEKGASLEEMPP